MKRAVLQVVPKPAVMKTLPVELLDLILEYCDHSSLKTLRLVDSFLRDKCAPEVFKDFHMAYFEDNLQNLIALAESPLGKHVKRLTFITDLLPQWSMRQWEQSIEFCCSSSCDSSPIRHVIPQRGFEYIQLRRHAQEVVLPQLVQRGPAVIQPSSHDANHFYSKNELELGWHRFKQLRDSQWKWRPAVEGLSFQRAFATLPNLTAATALSYDPTLTDAKDANHVLQWSMFGVRIEIKEKTWRDQSTYCTEWWSAFKPASAASCLLEAIGFRTSVPDTKPISKLVLQTTHKQGLQNLMSHLRRPGSTQPRVQAITDGLRHLTELCLHNIESEYRYAQSNYGYSPELPIVLSSATELRSLIITDPVVSYHRRIYQIGDSVLKQLVHVPNLWPRLEHLNISTMPIMWEVLVSLLRQVAPSLRSLELRNLSVKDPGRVLLEIPRTLALEYVYVESLLGSHVDDVTGVCSFRHLVPNGTDVNEPAAQALRDFLLRGRDTMPDLPGMAREPWNIDRTGWS